MKAFITLLLIISIIGESIVMFFVTIPSMQNNGSISLGSVLGAFIGCAIIPGIFYLWLQYLKNRENKNKPIHNKSST